MTPPQLQAKLAKINERQDKLHKEISDCTRARRIRINIELDRLANEERKLLNQNTEAWYKCVFTYLSKWPEK
jgi:hypothetical protein